MAYDADEDGYSEPTESGAWRCRLDAVAALLAAPDPEVLFFAGSSEEQAELDWDRKVVLTAPVLRHTADAVIDSTQPLSRVIDQVLASTLDAPRP